MEIGPELIDTNYSEPSRKVLGAYYTDPGIASFLIQWAIISPDDIVLDPSSGDGVFLSAAAAHLRALGGDPTQQVYGIDIDESAHSAFSLRCSADCLATKLIHRNFFEVEFDELPPVDAVVGNPPFIRYQRFNGQLRQIALRRASKAGVSLSKLTSSWAPFLVYASEFLKPGGRLGMVAPAEITYATYAKPVLEYLRRSFRTIKIISFARKLFPKLSEDTVLVLASGRGESFDSFRLVDLPAASSLPQFSNSETGIPAGVVVDSIAIGKGRERLLHYLLPQSTLDLYRQLRRSPSVALLGKLADVGIGYVTGDNDFFHVNGETILRYGIPPASLRRAVRGGSELTGLRFTSEDWGKLHRVGVANQLLYIRDIQPPPEPVLDYLNEGIRKGIPNRYKCRVRQPWYCVPHVYEADGFLTYMCGLEPRLAANEASAVAPNTLHVIRLCPSLGQGFPLGALGLSTLWQTSLTALSCEMEGHSLGGGMLKLEPGEAEQVAIASGGLKPENMEELADDLDHMLREGKSELARERADTVILRRGLGLSATDVATLRNGLLTLRTRRLNR